MKLVVIINGKGGVGKDTLCRYFCQFYQGQVASSITPIKKMAKRLGWKGGKDPEDRAFLSGLKDLMDERFGTSWLYLQQRLNQFENSDAKVLFVMIREPNDIEAFKNYVKSTGIRVKTLLVRREIIDGKTYGNHADDDVESYTYDYIFDNNSSLEEAHRDFIIMIRHMAESEEE